MLELVRLSKTFGTQKLTDPAERPSVLAVDDVSLTVFEGEFFSLLGPSGCGKTTLLRMLGGFVSPTSGQILHDRVRVDELPANKRPFNMVFQRYALFPHLDVGQNIAFGLRMKRVQEREIGSRVEEMLSLVKLEGYARRSVSTLSGGQQQRVALARALVNRPKVLLLDEPLSALDLKLRQQMQVELRAIQRRLKHTFIFVTHDQEEALTLSDRIAVMNEGVVEQVGTPREIYERPATRFVAQFIGSINQLEVEVAESRAGSLALKGFPSGVLNAPVREGAAPSVGTRMAAMVRPEKLRISDSATSDPGHGNGFEGIVRDVVYQGALTVFYVQPAGRSDALWMITQPNLAGFKAPSEGARVRVSWSPEDTIVLPAGAARA